MKSKLLLMMSIGLVMGCQGMEKEVAPTEQLEETRITIPDDALANIPSAEDDEDLLNRLLTRSSQDNNSRDQDDRTVFIKDTLRKISPSSRALILANAKKRVVVHEKRASHKKKDREDFFFDLLTQLNAMHEQKEADNSQLKDLLTQVNVANEQKQADNSQLNSENEKLNKTVSGKNKLLTASATAAIMMLGAVITTIFTTVWNSDC